MKVESLHLAIVITHKYEFGKFNFRSIKRILKSIDKFLLSMPVDNKFLALDALDPRQMQSSFERTLYDRFVSKVFRKTNLEVVTPSIWGHLSGNICNVISNIKAEKILVLHSDSPFIKHIDLDRIAALGEVNYIRFNRRSNIEAGWDVELKEVYIEGVKLCESSFYSDVNHLIKRTFFDTEIRPLIERKVNFPEIILKSQEWKGHGMYLYGAFGEAPAIAHYGLWDRVLSKQKAKTSNPVVYFMISSMKWGLLRIFKHFDILWKFYGYGDRAIK